MILLLLFLGIVAATQAAEEYDPEKAVKDMIAAYDKMNPITDDIMETLSAMSKHDEEYMQKFSAVSGLLFADVKPNTKEYYAKKLLRKHSLQILGDKRDRKPEKFQYYAELNETYQKKVNMGRIREFMSKIEQEMPSETELDEFCEYENPPFETLKYLSAVMFDRCQVSDEELEKEAVNYALGVAFFNNLERNIEMRWEYKYPDLKKRFLSLLSIMTNENAERALDIVLTNSDSGAINQLKREITDRTDDRWFVNKLRESNNFNCFPREIVQSHDFQFKPSIEEVEAIIKDVDELAPAAAFCIKQARFQNETERSEALSQISQNVTAIKNFTQQYLRKKLDSVWGGEILLEIAKAEFGTVDLEEAINWDAKAENIARNIRQALDIRGNKSYSHQVVIGDPWTDSQNSYTLCSPNNCFKVMDYYGANIYVFRYLKNDASKKAANAKKWFDENKAKITQILSGNYKVDNLGILTDRLFDNLSTNLIDSDRFNNILVLHKRTYLAKNAIIKVGNENVTLDGNPAMAFTEHFHNSYYTKAYRTKILFFI